MKSFIVVLTAMFAFSGSFAFAHGSKRHHHRHHMSRSVRSPNGTASGPTSPSGPGSSKAGY
ncbi:MAG: hypothetical protein KGL35_07865 [Bradyrhizobium sp.]|uniref:hypothetical protein n=1 Tax=Bradyrhizobium sp. TaxID=376 RepID=UPI0023903B94|nr:hypothetical protein [Bradyrhizobium sp.]MDE2468645.1 hypothetical protein [Bradyrhizobium sp.]